VRLYGADGQILPCPQCRRLHAQWAPTFHAIGMAPVVQGYVCPCGHDAPREWVLSTELVRVGRIRALEDPDDWPRPEAAQPQEALC